jgi:hypothetical protein
LDSPFKSNPSQLQLFKGLKFFLHPRVSYSSVVVRNRGLEELARVQNRGLEDQNRVQKTKAE